MIAVSAEEVDRLAEALTLGLKLTAVSRSGAGRVNGAHGGPAGARRKDR